MRRCAEFGCCCDCGWRCCNSAATAAAVCGWTCCIGVCCCACCIINCCC
ncbi:hypothetical protein ACFW04_005659 [Cataglyphis niger]